MVLLMDSKTENDSAFEKMVLPHLEVLYRTAWSLTRSEIEAQDLVQETLLKAYKAIERFDGRYPKAWLIKILKNTNINRARKKKPDLLRDPDETFNHSSAFADNVGPEQIVVDPVFDASVEMAYSNLAENAKQVINLVDLNGLSYQEAAARIDVPVGTVMSRLHRARKQIKQDLESQPKDVTP